MPTAEPEGAAAPPAPLRLTGGCHCGALELTFETRRQPGELTVRACGCSFCRRHASRTISDPQGRVEFVVHDPLRLHRYRFGLGTAEFLICCNCGVYVGAVMADAETAYAIVNINVLATPNQARLSAGQIFTQDAIPISYDRESAVERRARRRARWTPAMVVERSDAGRTAEPAR
jgi:hypothetical protein